MGLDIRIKQPENKVGILQIENVWKNACVDAFDGESCPRVGVYDEFYRMQTEFIGDEEEYDSNKEELYEDAGSYLLFDNYNYGSGIQLWFENDYIFVRISFPTTYSEIVSFYNFVNMMCTVCGTEEFYRGNGDDLELANVNQINDYIDLSVDDTLLVLQNIKNRLQDDMTALTINGVINPICINLENLVNWGINRPLEDNMKNVGNLLFNYEVYMHQIQQRDLYYAVFKLYDVEDEETEEEVVNGYICVAADCDTILPFEPRSEMYFFIHQCDMDEINQFYVFLMDSDGESYNIEYEKFLNIINADELEKYDASHFIVRLSDEEIEEIINEV